MLALLASVVLLFPQDPSSWQRGGSVPFAYDVVGNGDVTDSSGAEVVIRSVLRVATGFATATVIVPAKPYRGGRVRLSGELMTSRAADGASLWLRVDGKRAPLVTDVGDDQRLRGTTGWTPHEIVVTVPIDAERLVVGVKLTGLGESRARDLHVEAYAPDPDAGAIPRIEKYLDSALAIIRQHWLWKDTVPWDSVAARMKRDAAVAVELRQAHDAVAALLEHLGDEQSAILTPYARRGPAARKPATSHQPAVVRRLTDQIGHVTLGQDSVQRLGETLKRRIEAVTDSGACGWVVDLRNTRGTNLWPALAGLQPLLGDGWIGGFAGAADTVERRWTVAGPDSQPPASLAPARAESLAVAILIGPQTGAAGEGVLVSFLGRPETRSFGLGTAGATTATSSFALPDNARLLLTVSRYADRQDRVYRTAIQPDEMVAAPASEQDDPALEAATAWLKARPACSTP